MDAGQNPSEQHLSQRVVELCVHVHVVEVASRQGSMDVAVVGHVVLVQKEHAVSEPVVVVVHTSSQSVRARQKPSRSGRLLLLLLMLLLLLLLLRS